MCVRVFSCVFLYLGLAVSFFVRGRVGFECLVLVRSVLGVSKSEVFF